MKRSSKIPGPGTDFTEHAIGRIRRMLDEIRPMLRQNERQRRSRKED